MIWIATSRHPGDDASTIREVQANSDTADVILDRRVRQAESPSDHDIF
jgi:hypothetical protein